MMKFDIVARNLTFDEIRHEQYTFEQIWQGREISTWLKSTNCEMIAQRRFTGFKDHTGAEIYEKDVVRFTNPSPKKKNKRPVIDMVVGWKANRGCWALFWRGLDGELLWSTLGKQLDDNHSVVGNVYDNPDLVK